MLKASGNDLLRQDVHVNPMIQKCKFVGLRDMMNCVSFFFIEDKIIPKSIIQMHLEAHNNSYCFLFYCPACNETHLLKAIPHGSNGITSCSEDQYKKIMRNVHRY